MKAETECGSRVLREDMVRCLDVELPKLDEMEKKRALRAQAQEKDVTLHRTLYGRARKAAWRSMLPVSGGGYETIPGEDADLVCTLEPEIQEVKQRIDKRRRGEDVAEDNPQNPQNSQKKRRVDAAVQTLLENTDGMDPALVAKLKEVQPLSPKEGEKEEKEEEEKETGRVRAAIDNILAYCDLPATHVARLKEIQATPEADLQLDTLDLQGGKEEGCGETVHDLLSISGSIDRGYRELAQGLLVYNVVRTLRAERGRESELVRPGHEYDTWVDGIYPIYWYLEHRHPGAYIERMRHVWHLITDFWGDDFLPAFNPEGRAPLPITGLSYPPPLKNLRRGPTARVLRALEME